ncbi:hypothetical protein D3C81_1991280 [compost metagenome]
MPALIYTTLDALQINLRLSASRYPMQQKDLMPLLVHRTRNPVVYSFLFRGKRQRVTRFEIPTSVWITVHFDLTDFDKTFVL